MAFKILIAEDEEITLKQLLSTLQKEGWEAAGHSLPLSSPAANGHLCSGPCRVPVHAPVRRQSCVIEQSTQPVFREIYTLLAERSG